MSCPKNFMGLELVHFQKYCLLRTHSIGNLKAKLEMTHSSKLLIDICTSHVLFVLCRWFCLWRPFLAIGSNLTWGDYACRNNIWQKHVRKAPTQGSRQRNWVMLSSGNVWPQWLGQKLSWATKGQLISKCPFGVIKPSKKRTIFFQDFCPSL